MTLTPAELAEMEKRHEKSKNHECNWKICPTVLQSLDDVPRLLHSLKAAREALMKYGNHLPGCHEVNKLAGYYCTCGFTAALTGGTNG